MNEQILTLFRDYPNAAFFISLALSIFIALLGVVPSFFITAANILFFGFWKGTAVSFLGEALGAIAAFWLYRKGFKQKIHPQVEKFPRVQRLLEAEGKQAFLLIVSLRLLPFIPSGLVTFAAAIGRVSVLLFIVASSLGKIPALLVEAYSVYQVTRYTWQGKLILLIAALSLAFLASRKKFRKT
ncbi:MAG TPA: VTT domain-containing protein [Flavisolibacter sp.]|nr:VTT domain-containing protein [Flavisolibacter sp.]